MEDLTGAVVFVVEDEPIVAYDLRLTLEDAGAEVIGPALDLEQAQVLASGDMSVALLDVRLGDRDVFAVAARLWERGIPLVFHTGHGNVEALLSRWPGSRVLLKPVRAEMLLSTIARMLTRAGKRDPASNGV
jgi:DNA-binding LytR/AlgR family response regulator